MEPEGRTSIVTGAASGIGRALAWKLAEAGAAGVMLADIDRERAEAVADEISGVHPGRARAVGCDVADPAGLAALIAACKEAFGPVDIFFANAGVAAGVDLEPSDEVWDLAFDVNIRSHIIAARLLVPGWLERGGGYFVSTASAAGLLTQIGSAPYAVTKHAAVAFAEWLSVSYGDRGIGVSCLCPMGVNTSMLKPGRELSERERVASRAVVSAGAVLEPEEVADRVIEGLQAERFLILPHPEVLDFYRFKGSDYDRWIGGMRRLAAKLEGASA
ncbi:MAG: SDR family oxidoreductase [Thermoleophilaceae bacterium]